MKTLTRHRFQREEPSARATLRWDILFKDLDLLVSLTLARFIVWRTLRQRRRQRLRRLKLLRVARTGSRAWLR